MAVHGNVSLFRMPVNADSTTNENSILTDKIEMEGDAEIPDNTCKFKTFKPIMSRFKTSNPAPFSEMIVKPDTGYSGTQYQLNVLFDERAGRSLAITKFRDWLAESNTVRGKFRHGRIGVRNNYRPEFDLTPNNGSGYKLVYFELFQDLAVNYLIPGLAILEHGGEPKG